MEQQRSNGSQDQEWRLDWTREAMVSLLSAAVRFATTERIGAIADHQPLRDYDLDPNSLSMDSLEVLDLSFCLEEMLEVTFDDSLSLTGVRTVGELVEFLLTYVRDNNIPMPSVMPTFAL